LQNKCLNLEGFLKQDLDGLDLFSELKVLKEILQIEESALIDILNYIKRLDSFPNACIAYRILLTIPVTEGRNPKKIYIQKQFLRNIQRTHAKNLLLLVSHYGNEPSSTHVA
jgi:hypothetical protein